MRAKLGSVYQRKKKRPDGSEQVLPTWWIQYCSDGKVFRESSGSEKRSDAEKLLKRRSGEIVTGKFLGFAPERVSIAELFSDVVEDYVSSDRATVADVKSRLKNHLNPFFGNIRAVEFSTQHVKRYVGLRRKDEAQNATINRELAILRRAFNLAAKCDPPKVARVPHIQMLKENNARTGFVEYESYASLRDELPWYLQPLFVVAYHVGGRRGELTSVRWSQVDLKAGQIRLHAADTKNEEARTLPVYGEMQEWLQKAKRIRDNKFPNCPWVFYTDEGERLYWFYAAWESACSRAGIPKLLFHDLRRSAVRNMERAGVPRKIAMSISGHKTENVYRRYDIVAERDLADASARLNQYFTAMSDQAAANRAQVPEKNGSDTLSSTPGDFGDPSSNDPTSDAEPKPGI